MQRKKPYETIIDTKEVNLEKKIITRTITNYNSEQKSPGIITYPAIQKNSAFKSLGGQELHEIKYIPNLKKPELKNNQDNQINLDKKFQKHKVYLSSRYNNTKHQENTPNLVEQISMNEDVNDFNLFSIRGKKSDGKGEPLFSNKKDTRNMNIKFNMNPIFDTKQITEQDNNNKINTNESIKINSSSINNKYNVQYLVVPQTKLSPIQKCEEGSTSFDNKKFSE